MAQKQNVGRPSIANAPPQKKKPGRPQLWQESMQARFKVGTLAAIETLLGDGETKVDFVNAAVTREIARREKGK